MENHRILIALSSISLKVFSHPIFFLETIYKHASVFSHVLRDNETVLWNRAREIGAQLARVDSLAHARRLTAVLSLHVLLVFNVAYRLRV